MHVRGLTLIRTTSDCRKAHASSSSGPLTINPKTGETTRRIGTCIEINSIVLELRMRDGCVTVNHDVAEIAFEFEELPPDAHQVRRLLLLERNTRSQPGVDEQIRPSDEVRQRVGKKTRVRPRERLVESLPLRVLGREEGKLARLDAIRLQGRNGTQLLPRGEIKPAFQKIEQELLVIPTQKDRLGALGSIDQGIDHTSRIVAAIDVVAKIDLERVGRSTNADEVARPKQMAPLGATCPRSKQPCSITREL